MCNVSNPTNLSLQVSVKYSSKARLFGKCRSEMKWGLLKARTYLPSLKQGTSVIDLYKLHTMLWMNIPENYKLYSSYITEDYMTWQ